MKYCQLHGSYKGPGECPPCKNTLDTKVKNLAKNPKPNENRSKAGSRSARKLP